MANEVKVIGISGPDGGGKGYLSLKAMENLGLEAVWMVTTRPPRPHGEEKICVSQDEYKQMLEGGQLVGEHVNKGNNYAYRISDFRDLSKGAILELNPVYQSELPEQMRAHGITFAGWIGLYGELDYLAANMKSRDDSITEESLQNKLGMATDIMDRLKALADSGIVTMFRVGWENRDTMADEFSQVVNRLLQSPQES